MTLPMPLPIVESKPQTEQIFVDVSHLEPIIRFLAEGRSAINRSKQVRDRKVGAQSGMETDIRGISAELAFCMHYNVWPDMELKPRSGGHDCVYKGVELDIKGAPPRGNLLAERTKTPVRGLAYVLCVGRDFQYRIVGWCWSLELIRIENLKYWDENKRDWIHVSQGQPTGRYKPSYMLSQHKLRKMSDLGKS